MSYNKIYIFILRTYLTEQILKFQIKHIRFLRSKISIQTTTSITEPTAIPWRWAGSPTRFITFTIVVSMIAPIAVPQIPPSPPWKDVPLYRAADILDPTIYRFLPKQF